MTSNVTGRFIGKNKPNGNGNMMPLSAERFITIMGKSSSSVSIRKCALWILILLGAIQWCLRWRTMRSPDDLQQQKSRRSEKKATFEDAPAEHLHGLQKEERHANRAHIPSNGVLKKNSPVKVPFPIFVASLYKSGTTSVHEYFKCGGQPTSHKWGATGHIGLCMRENIQQGRPAFFRCGQGEYSVFTDNSKSCWDPSVYELQGIYDSYPNATIILGTRDSYNWIDSVDRFRFRRWALLDMLLDCGEELWPGKTDLVGDRNLTKDDVRQFYLWHMQHVRDFADAHPSLTFIDFDIESEDAGAFLEDTVGISQYCWGNENQNMDHPATGSTLKEGGKKSKS